MGVWLIYNSFLVHLPFGLCSQVAALCVLFSLTVVFRCHEEMLERMAKKTTVMELEVRVLLPTAVRNHYVT